MSVCPEELPEDSKFQEFRKTQNFKFKIVKLNLALINKEIKMNAIVWIFFENEIIINGGAPIHISTGMETLPYYGVPGGPLWPEPGSVCERGRGCVCVCDKELTAYWSRIDWPTDIQTIFFLLAMAKCQMRTAVFNKLDGHTSVHANRFWAHINFGFLVVDNDCSFILFFF